MLFKKKKVEESFSAGIPDVKETPKVHDRWKENEAWEANEGRRERIAQYRKLTLMNESDEICEDNIQDWALKRVCVDSGWPVERVKAELLGQKYTGLEED